MPTFLSVVTVGDSGYVIHIFPYQRLPPNVKKQNKQMKEVLGLSQRARAFPPGTLSSSHRLNTIQLGKWSTGADVTVNCLCQRCDVID